MELLYCPKCEKEEPVKLVTKDEKYEVRGENFSIKANVYICNNCNEEIFEEEMDKNNLEMLYSAYRAKHALLTPNKIKEIRNKYGLSQRAISRLLQWGEVTFSRYENGSIQDPVHNEVLELIDKPENMLEIYEKNKGLLTPIEKKALEKRLKQLVVEKQPESGLGLLEALLTTDKCIDEYSGFKVFDLQKTKNLILYIAEQQKGILKTKTNKLLFYIDFLFFKVFSVSMTGNKYFRLQYGPIPNDYDWIINLMINEEILEKNEIIYSKDIVGEELKAKISVGKDLFTKDELKVMDFCIKKFEKLNCGQISKYSHDEKPYLNTEEKKSISYKWAKDLSLNLE